MKGHVQRTGRRVPLIGAAFLSLVVGADRSLAEVPEGLKVGPWVLAPFFSTSYAVDSNVFYETEEAESSDRVTELYGGLLSSLPFRNSMLEINLESTDLNYHDNEFDRPSSQLGEVQLELNFKTGDRLTLSDEFRKDFTRRLDPLSGQPGDEFFVGEPYSVNSWEVALERGNRKRQGYLMRLRRRDFTYDNDVIIGSFEYRGFDTTFQYRQPLPGDRSWTLTHSSKRYNHYDPAEPVGQPFRKEEVDAITLGIRGELGEDQPYRAQLGYSRFRYQGQPSESKGVVGLAQWQLKIGGRTALDLIAVRQPLPSNQPTFYINNAVRADLEREWRRFEAGVEVRIALSAYQDPFDGPDDPPPDENGKGKFNCPYGSKRRDLTYEAGLHWAWKVHDLFAFEFSGFSERRDSNCDDSEYKAHGIEAGITVGW